ncbi:MAG: lysine--tRNA ligase [Wolinella sp.]
MFSNQYIKQRISKSDELREIGKNPYDNDVKRTITNVGFLEKFHSLKELQSDEKKDENVCEDIVGRIKFLRHMGKAAFAKIEDESGVVQIYFSQNELAGDFAHLKKFAEVGDIVAVSGFPFVTRTGELSLHAREMKILTKAIVPLPEKYHGLVDIELRYRQRYLDLIMNPEVKETFKLRSRIVSSVRRFFEDKGFLEVETPMMHPIPGGANAKPFITHHNALGVDRYLRIAPELYLKRLVVGGFEAVFEINRNFRNEGMDHSHNPEFTMIEFYWAYKTYHDLMDLTEELFGYLFKKLELPKILPHGDDMIDFSRPFRRISYKNALHEIGGVPLSVIESESELRAYMIERGVRLEGDMGLGKLWAEAFDAFVEEKLISPTFVTDFPIEISPLARRNNENPELADRFELFIGKKEISNGFSELNDPLDQLERFRAQVDAKNAGDEEAQHMDEDYVWALGHGMAPTAGEGIGIDRLVMLLTNNRSIKDVILFPALKPQKIDYTITTKDEES